MQPKKLIIAMLLTLQRTLVSDHATRGSLQVDDRPFSATLEPGRGQGKGPIPAGWYKVKLTYSPHFQRILPVLEMVPGRSGIRMHSGNTTEHTTGCILVGEDDPAGQIQLINSRKTENRLIRELRKTEPHEEIYIHIVDPELYSGYDSECPPAERMP